MWQPVGHYQLRPDRSKMAEMDNDSEKLPPGWLIESLERSEAQINAGETVPLERVLDRLRASIARMETVVSEQRSNRKG